jgi:hypothetical protein
MAIFSNVKANMLLALHIPGTESFSSEDNTSVY